MTDTPKGHMIPQTVESLQAIMAADAVTMQGMDAELKKQRARNNKLAQKLAKARRESLPVVKRVPPQGYCVPGIGLY